MKKLAYFFIIAIFTLANANSVFATAWAIQCINTSCSATAGGLRVLWSSPANNFQGTLTGVEGLPLTIEDFQTVEKKVQSTLEPEFPKN